MLDDMRSFRRPTLPLFALAALLGAGLLASAACGGEAAPPAKPTDPFKDIYARYRPSFLHPGLLASEKMMKLSTEWHFFTLNRLEQDDRANALVGAAIGKEHQGQYREALKMYQIVIDKYPHQLYRVSDYGVFVPISQYCQRRILNLPPAALDHYRTLHDARAREAFEQARRKHSLIGLSEIVDQMLATSYGSKAIVELGNAALDSGHFLEALEQYTTVRDFFPGSADLTPGLDLKTAYCQKMLGGARPTPAAAPEAQGDLPAAVRRRLEKLVQTATPQRRPFHSQQASAPAIAADDYTLFPPTTDPLGLQEPVWERPLPGSREDFFVFAQPVVTENSVIYRYKNLVYCRSILNGETRWVNELGGRARWQHRGARQYPQEDLVAQDGLVFTVLSKGGPSLVALDEVTGQLKWAYGPMVASTREEARMRFEAAPAGGPRTIYAGYVLDNIEGNTHTDTEYGVIAFESATGRILWRRPVCRLSPGKFAAGFAVRVRNRIRSFISPPLYHQGTVYYNTNAGAIAALDSRSGRVKWLIRYPYHRGVHDASRQFGRGGGPVRYTRILFTPHDPMFWYNQRPLLIGERLYVLPVDCAYILCMDRRTGKVQWNKRKGMRYDTRGWRRIVHVNANSCYFLGALKTGELVFAYSFQKKPVLLVNPKTGATLWPIVQKHVPSAATTHSVERESSPSMSLSTPSAGLGKHSSVPMNGRHYELGARPLLTTDGKLHLAQWNYIGWPIYAWTSSLCSYDLVNRKVLGRRRYYSGRLLGYVYRSIHEWAPQALKAHEDLPHKDAKVKQWIKNLRLVVKDSVPTNRYGPFLPFARVTFHRHGVPFELRFGAQSVAMVYDRSQVGSALAKRSGPAIDFAKAELAFADARYADAAALLRACLKTMSSEDLDFRASVNQQLYRVYRRLARAGVRSGDPKKELDSCLGMSRTATTLADEIETLFALSEVYERTGNLRAAARCLRSIVSTYGHHEYPVPEVLALETPKVLATANGVLDRTDAVAAGPYFGEELQGSIALFRKGLPLYLSTVSPLPKALTLRAGGLAAKRLLRLQASSPEFRRTFEATAAAELTGRAPDEQLHRLWEFPGTSTGQKILGQLFDRAAPDAGKKDWPRLRQLADVARICGLTLPEQHRARVLAPRTVHRPRPIELEAKERALDLADPEGINWLVLERRGDRSVRPELLFLGGRVRKRLDNKFTLAAVDLDTGQVAWEKKDLRLRGTGQEAGFFEAFVHGGLIVVHGLYDVLAHDLKTGTVRWRYRVPFDFEIKHAVMSGDLLVLSGKTETIALHLATASPAGEVAWQVKEMGDVYIPAYFHGDRLVTVRKMPFNVTVRSRPTGRLIGRLDLPDLSMHVQHPLLEDGPKAVPTARRGKLLLVSDGWYYILVDTDRIAITWKRLIDNSDLTREPTLRFALSPKYLAVIKEDYDVKTIYMLSTETGRVLWHTDPRNARSPQPIYSMRIEGDTVYGIGPYPGQGVYFVGLNCKSGAPIFRREVKGYDSKPKVTMMAENFGGHAVLTVQDRQRFELKAFSLATGKELRTYRKKGAGNFGVHGRVSATVQNGRLILLSKDDLSL